MVVSPVLQNLSAMDRRQQTSYSDAQSRKSVDKFALFRGENNAGGTGFQTPRPIDKFALFRGGNVNLGNSLAEFIVS